MIDLFPHTLISSAELRKNTKMYLKSVQKTHKPVFISVRGRVVAKLEAVEQVKLNEQEKN